MKNDDDFIHLPELYLKLGTLKKHLNNIYNLNINPMENSTKNINFKALEQSLNVGGYDDERMAMISCDIILEYAVKLDKIVMEDTELEEWVKSKISKTEQMMASIKHGLIGIEKYDHGGEMFKKKLLHIAKYAKAIMEELEKGVELMSWMESNLAVCADYMDGVYHQLDYKMGNRAKDVAADGIMMKDGGGVGVYENVNIPSLNKSGMVTNLFTENGKEMVAVELLNGKGIKIEASKVEKKYANGGGLGKKIESLEAEKKKLIEEWKIATGAEKDKLYKKWQDVGIDLSYAQRDMYRNKEIEERNKMTIDFMKALEEDGIMTPGSHKNKANVDSIKSIISMDGYEFSKYIKKVKDKKIDGIYREFQDWKQTYHSSSMMANGGGIERLNRRKGESNNDMFSRISKEVAERHEHEDWGDDYETLFKEFLAKKYPSITYTDYQNLPKKQQEKITNEYIDYSFDNDQSLGRGMRFKDGGGVGNQGLLNKNYLDSIPAEKKAFILKGIAEHYGISVKKVLEEVTSSDAEELADYIMGRGALEVFNAMKSMKMTNGGNMMAAQGMFLDGEFEETVRKVKDYISKYPYVWKNGNKSYVPIEGWQYAASLMGLSARVTEVYAVPEKNGWMAKAEVVNQTGVIVCSGFGFVGRDEEKWAKSTESDLESFSQTKAVSRALRNCISYLIKAAGYSTTPAEEMYGLKGSSKSMNSKKPNLRPIYGVPDIDGQVGHYDMPVQKPIEKASTEERSNLSILLQKVWAESKGRGMVIVSPEFMQKIEDNLFDLDATSLSFEVLLADAYDWMIKNNVLLRSKIFMKEIAKAINNLGN